MLKAAIKNLETQKNLLLGNPPEKMGSEFVSWHAKIFDTYFQDRMKENTVCSTMHKEKYKFSVIALGGYGRNEQCLYSDIDILFLFENNVPVEAENIIREMVYPLWDLKFEVGHSTRTVKECISIATIDYQILTSLLDARWICGDQELFLMLKENLYQKLIQKKKKKILLWLSENSRKRHEYFKAATYLLEPNVKEGLGGLRDYHTMLWMAKAVNGPDDKGGNKDLLQIPDKGCMIFMHSLSFIWEVRNKLHQLAGKKCDRLYSEFHEDLAEYFHSQRNDDLHIIERFLGEFHENVDVVKQRFQLFQSELIGTSGLNLMFRFLGKKTKVKGLIVRNNRLDFHSMEACVENPTLLIKIFLESRSLGLPICGEAKRTITKLSYLINDEFRKMKSVISAFEEVLNTADSENDILDEMLSSGFLAGLIPELKNIANRIEYDEYHAYPVDKHLLLTIRTINGLGRNNTEGENKLFYNLYHEITEIKLLQWAALLHDIGKGGHSADHSNIGAVLAEFILRRFGYQEAAIMTGSFLIKNHLLLKKTATQRDLNDEQTAISCASEIKDVARLKMLYLLTVADCASTGSKAWTSWTSILIRDLFFRVLRVLEKGELATETSLQIIRTKKEVFQTDSVWGKHPEESVSLWNNLSQRYLLAVEAKDIMDHLGLFKNLGEKKFVWHVTQNQCSETRTVTICAKNHAGLFSKLTGIFSLHNLNVLDVQAFTWRNDIALDIFQVTAPKDRLFEEKIWKRAEAVLENTLEGNFDIATALGKKFKIDRQSPFISLQKNSSVNIDDQTSAFFVIIEVHTYDSPGLLFWIADAIFNYGYDILVCKAATSADQVVDIFYIRDFDGQKPDKSEKLFQLKKAIEEIVKANSHDKPTNSKRSKK
ncbi:MAG: [protein-PII] uridylyltransferase [Pseudomonadota bacterium]